MAEQRVISKEFVLEKLKEFGYNPLEIKEITGGSNHFIFDVKLPDKEVIVKLAKLRDMGSDNHEEQTDTLFGGKLSPQREQYIINEIKSSGAHAPAMYGIYQTQHGQLQVREKLFGNDAFEHIKQRGFKLTDYLDFIKNVASELGKLHCLRYPSFGNIMPDEIEPQGITNFADRSHMLNNRIIERCREKNYFEGDEEKLIVYFFENATEKLRPLMDRVTRAPTMVITDLHMGNFLVDDNNMPTGFFDIESAQAAPCEYELFALRFFVFNIFSEKEFKEGEKVFFEEYCRYNKNFTLDADSDSLIDYFSACRLLEISQSYWGYVDGIRDFWGAKYKAILINYIKTGRIDYAALGDILRERDGTPKGAN